MHFRCKAFHIRTTCTPRLVLTPVHDSLILCRAPEIGLNTMEYSHTKTFCVCVFRKPTCFVLQTKRACAYNLSPIKGTTSFRLCSSSSLSTCDVSPSTTFLAEPSETLRGLIRAIVFVKILHIHRPFGF